MNKDINIKVSVVVTTYNHKSYIKQCLDGILMQQTTSPFEIILGEDESSDGTREICKEYAKKYPDKISLFLRSRKDVIYINGNPTGRFNFIENLKVAKGKYIALCEGDDYWTDPLKLQKQVDFLEANDDFSGCFHNTMFIDETQVNSKLEPWRVYNKNIFMLEDTISTLALFHTSSFVFRRINLSIPNWFISVQSADMALFALIASQGLLYRMDEYMSVYRKNAIGITNFIKIKEYHINRIKLNTYLKKSFDVHVHKKIDEVIKYHTLELSKIKSGFFKNLKALIKF